ncbi:MAG TPA: AzlD domain-containing protein [Clostridiales bacterium]|nr:AzlD domain-containing protein [Clostridiales bacterium]
MKSYLPLIFGMAVVTYLPRLIPLVYLTKKKPGPRLKRFLELIPYTSLSILIVRGIITSSQDMIGPAIVGISLAGISAYFKANLVVSVLIGIVASFLMINMK